MFSSGEGVPMTSKMIFNWSPFSRSLLSQFAQLIAVPGERGQHDLPGKSGTLEKASGKFYSIILNSSAKMQPTDHISMEQLQYSFIRMTSGARYHLVTTCLVSSLLIYIFLSFPPTVVLVDLSAGFTKGFFVASLPSVFALLNKNSSSCFDFSSS